MARLRINISEGVLHSDVMNFSGSHISKHIYIYDFKFYFLKYHTVKETHFLIYSSMNLKTCIDSCNSCKN